MQAGRASFSVDIQGLFVALAEQFPDPLLAVRELIQNAADAGATRIDVDVAYDRRRGMTRLSVRDDGRGMGQEALECYLTIGSSSKNPGVDRGRFGIGKLSPYALRPDLMIVESSDGQAKHRLKFDAKGCGEIKSLKAGSPGTIVQIYIRSTREAALITTEATAKLVRETCGALTVPLFVNGEAVNHDFALPGLYTHRFAQQEIKGEIGLVAEPIRHLMGAGIVLESNAPILGDAVSYVLDSPRLSPTLSRNAVRRDANFAALLELAQQELPHLRKHVATQFKSRVESQKSQIRAVERALDAHDRAAMEWLRQHLLDRAVEHPEPYLTAVPILETVNGDLVSVDELVALLSQEGHIPTSRVPRAEHEISPYLDRGAAVLLLYRDLEDFFERQAIDFVEVGDVAEAVEIPSAEWSPGEVALAANWQGASAVAAQRSKKSGLRVRMRLWLRALRHPFDFWVAKGWAQQEHPNSTLSHAVVTGDLVPSARFSQLQLGFVHQRCEPQTDVRLLVCQAQRVLLNRAHPSVAELTALALVDLPKARLYLDMLLATDTELTKNSDPRRVEWELLRRAEAACLRDLP